MSTTDERLERYLHDRSASIDLPHAGVEAITRRARRHRRRRHAALGGAVAAVMLGGTAIVIAGGPAEDVTRTTDKAASIGASPLEWTVVPVETGIGWGSTAISDGSSVYSLSTAPGPEDVDTTGRPRQLYRSDDGTDWEGVALPDGLFPSSVAAEDGTVYAVGTAAAGGETVGVELATSADGGSGWDSSAVPLDLAALGDGFPGRVRVSDAEVATAGGTTVVAVSTTGIVDVADLVPAGEAESWFQGDGGLTEIVAEACAWADPGETTTVPAGDPASPDTTDVPASTQPPSTEAPTTVPPSGDPAVGAEPDPADDPAVTRQPGASGAVECEGEGPYAPREQRSWAELGLTAEQAAVADGQTHLFVSGPDGALTATHVIDQGSYADPSTSRLLAADDGWWLVDTDMTETSTDLTSAIVAWHSTDGAAWASEVLAADESVITTGVIDGRPVVVGVGQAANDFTARVHRVEGPGAVSTVDLNELLGMGDTAGIWASAVGPAGVAVVMGDAEAGSELEEPHIVHSADGVTFGIQALPEPEAGTRDAINGLTITPDAIKVRLNVRPADDDDGLAPPSVQRLFVGTPAG